MVKISAIVICSILTLVCLGQPNFITKRDTLNLNQFDCLHEVSSNEILLPEYDYLDSLHFVQIEYLSDSCLVEGFIVCPKYVTNTPIVVFNRGGHKNYINISDRTLIDWITPIARHGFSVFASQYRSNDEFGGADIKDVLQLIRIAKKEPGTDSTKIGMVGWSRGGLMTYLALTYTKDIDCAVIGGAPTDMTELIRTRPKIDSLLAVLIPDFSVNRNKELFKRSPLMWTDKLHPTDLLIIHGQMDERVHYSHAVAMSQKLNLQNYPHTLSIIENDDHILRNNKSLKDYKIAQWLTEKLKTH